MTRKYNTTRFQNHRDWSDRQKKSFLYMVENEYTADAIAERFNIHKAYISTITKDLQQERKVRK